jgi:DNA-directed RNA polymerase subunit RPC12/RpoP
MTSTYVCDHCGREFPRTAEDDEKAQAESVSLWGRGGDAPDMAIVCSECWQKFMAWFRENPTI